MPDEKPITLHAAVEQVLAQVEGPITVDEFARRVLVTIEDWEDGRFRLEHEPAGRCRQPEIERQNQELADLLFEMLEAAQHERLSVREAIPTAYARLSDPRGYPGDHWTEVVQRDPRMKWDGTEIHYSDFRLPLDVLFSEEEEEEAAPEEPYTQAQARQVYRFKAALWHQPGLWRLIEVRGGQTLADFDAILREAFRHDTYDHLSGFWRLVQRGKGVRFREIELGDIDPDGEGSGADLHIAGLGLKGKYPRIVEKSQPQYQDCQACKAKGRKTSATWICLRCSNIKQQDVLLCEKCMLAEHEDHHTEEIVY